MTVPDIEGYAGLLADLETNLRVRHGLAQILDLEGGPVTLAADLSRLVATDRGLASILGTLPKDPSPHVIQVRLSDQTEDGRTTEVHAATAQDRIMLRFGRSRRYLATMRRIVQELLDELIAASPSERNTDPDPAGMPGLLQREYVVVSQAATALTSTLPTVVDLSGLTVLVVDDEPDLRDIVERMLQRRGLTTISAEDHQSAIDICRNHDVDVLICDLALPKAGDLAQTAIQLRPAIGIVCLSGLPDGVSVAELVDDRVVLARPSGREQLLTSVRTAVERGRTRDARSSLPAARVEHALKLSCENLARLHDQISGQADTLGVGEHRRSVALAGQLLRLLDGAWASACDFRGEDLTAAQLVSLEDLDGVRWSDDTASYGPTRWPHDLEHTVREHSRRVLGQPAGVWEITLGTEVTAEPRPAQARI